MQILLQSASSSAKSVKFSNYKDDNYIKNCFNKIKRYENHIKLFKSHIGNGSSPPSLFYNRFPVPFLADDENYVEDYNDLINEFQTKAMNLSIKYLYKRISKNEEKLQAKKDSMKEKNDSKLVDTHVTSLESTVNKDLEKYFTDKNEQFNRITIQKYVAKNQNIYNNNRNQNDSLVSIYDTKNVTRNMEPIVTNNNSNDSNDAPYNTTSTSSNITSINSSHNPRSQSRYNNPNNNTRSPSSNSYNQSNHRNNRSKSRNFINRNTNYINYNKSNNNNNYNNNNNRNNNNQYQNNHQDNSNGQSNFRNRQTYRQPN